MKYRIYTCAAIGNKYVVKYKTLGGLRWRLWDGEDAGQMRNTLKGTPHRFATEEAAARAFTNHLSVLHRRKTGSVAISSLVSEREWNENEDLV